MVDNRSAGHFGIGGAFNFKSGDISGSAAKLSDDKMGQGGEYFAQGENDDEQNQNEQPYVDRSSQLRATLNSMAMMNVASVLNSKRRLSFLDEKNETGSDEKKDTEKNSSRDDDEHEEFLDDFEEKEDNEYY